MNNYLPTIALIAAGLLTTGPAAAKPPPDPTDLLQQYLRIDTTNPPGNEALATEFIARVLDAEGIDYTIDEAAPGRANLWARLAGGDRPGLLLLHHTDVVSADADAWDVLPLAGEIRDGHLYGRGALDMKGLGIMHLVAFIELHRAGRPLNRDVIFMATADEEAGSAFGMGWMMENHADEFDTVGLALTEGGGGVGMNGAISYGVEVAQKYPVWLRLTATGTPGHGSTPGADGAVDRLLSALDTIRDASFEPRIVPAVDAYFKDLSGRFPGKLGLALQDAENAITDPQFSEMLRTNIPQLYALTRNTCAITRLNGSDKVNVLPPSASAEIDCRLLPDQDRDAFLAGLEQRINDPKVSIEILMSLSPAESPADSELFGAIEAAVLARFPEASVGPSVTTGFTDSHHLRKRGIVSYGLMPAVIPLPDWGGIHGNNERISLENITLGTELTRDIVERLVYD